MKSVFNNKMVAGTTQKILKSCISLLVIFVLTSCGSGNSTVTWQEQYDLGMQYLADGDYEAAIVAFTAAIEIEPNKASLYIARGDTYVLYGETEEHLTLAYEDYNTAISINSAVAEAYLGLADVYILQGDIDSAVAILTEGLERAENTASIQKKLDELSENAEESVEIVESSVWDGSIADSFDGGSGTEDDPYQIASASQLAYLAQSVNGGNDYQGKYFVLTDDIDLGGLEWTPIGADDDFEGNFDGDGHVISGLYISQNYEYIGLFGYIYSGEASISNLTLDGYISLTESGRTTTVGMLIGEYNSHFSGNFIHIFNCVVSGTIEICDGSGTVGGVLGTGTNLDISDIYSSVEITGNDVGSASMGGIVGKLELSSMPSYIQKCVFTGNVDVISTEDVANLNIGGIIGYLSSDGEDVTIQQCYNSGILSFSGNSNGGCDLGGIIGIIYNGDVNESIQIINCYNEGNIDCSKFGIRFAVVGGIIGQNYAYDNLVDIIDCYNTGSLFGQGVEKYPPCVGGIIGWEYHEASLSGCYNEGTVSADASGSSEYVGDLIGRSADA